MSPNAMTRCEEELARTVCDAIRGLEPHAAARRLVEMGWIRHRPCERQRVRELVERLDAEGIRRCEAFRIVADRLCCSYGKVRELYYREKGE